MIENENLHPGFVYDPFIIIEKMKTTDEILALWLKVAMEGVQKGKLQAERIYLGKEIENIVEMWEGLLNSKDIAVELANDMDSETEFMIANADLYIILNNIFLNSVYFLEKAKNPERKIVVSLKEQEGYFYLSLWNNGPELDEKYRGVEERIFELGETSKESGEGTGIGLWIVREIVERYDGSVTVSEQRPGFGLDIYLKK